MPPVRTVRVVDRGANALLARLQKRRPIATEVGVIGAPAIAQEHGGGVTVGQVATWAEFGIGQPERSWLRGWIDSAGDLLGATLRQEMGAVYTGARSTAQASARVGAWIVGQIQERISRGIAPPNAQSTIDKKGSSTPLIDKGQLRSSISSRVVD